MPAHQSSGVHPHRLTLASKVTICRLAGIPVFILLVLYYLSGLREGMPSEVFRYSAASIFALIALTDALDGYLARSRNEVTRLGRILDPIADKALLVSSVILLTRPSLSQLQPQFHVWFTLLVISRDVFLIAGALLLRGLTGHVEIQPHVSGKAATLCLMVMTLVILFKAPSGPFLILQTVTGLLIFISGVLYIRDGLFQFERSHDQA